MRDRLEEYQFIAGYIAHHGKSPFLSEIAAHMGYSKVAAHKAVKSLEQAGWIKREPAQEARNIILVE